MRRLWLSLGLVAVGAAMLAGAQLAGAAFGFRQGGIFRYGTVGASVQIDPQLAYLSTAWWMEYATAAKLVNYPDRPGQAGTRLVPEVASRYRVSRDGLTWTFLVRKGFRFSDGLPVTAASFKYAIDRVANHDLASPGAPFITDPNGANIVGARAVNSGRATHVTGVVAKGNRLVIHLTRPDPTLLTKLAMPFFHATPARLPLSREVTGGYPSAGPYFFSRNETNVLTQLRRNPYYGGRRPHNLRGVDVQWNLNEGVAYQRVLENVLDSGPLPAPNVRDVARRFGVNKARFWVEPQLCIGYIAFNNDRPLLRRNIALRRAINWALDRRALLAHAPAYSGSPWTHLLSPAVPGSITAKKLQPYVGAPRLRKARQLAGGHLRRGRVNIGYRSSGGVGTAQAELIRAVLVKLGIRADRIKLKGFSGADLYDVMGKRNTDLDLGVSLGWCGDYPDPAAIMNPLLSGAAPYVELTPKYRRKLAAAQKLQGAARLRAFGRLDIELMNDLAPVAVTRTYNSLYFFSNRVNPASLVYENVYTDWSIPALALK
jgi:peptide/nickel transport system substrate-binding protein